MTFLLLSEFHTARNRRWLMPAVWMCMFVVAACGQTFIGASAHAQEKTINLASQAVVVHNYVQSYVRHGGEPFVFGTRSLLTDGNPATGLQPRGKYDAQNCVTFWYSDGEPVTVNGLSFQMANHQPVRWRVQTWDGSNWSEAARVDPKSTVGSAVSFSPRITRGVRLIVDETFGIGFDDYRLNEIAVFGPVQSRPAATEVGWKLATDKKLNVFTLGEEIVVRGAITDPSANPGDTQLRWDWTDWYLQPLTAEFQQSVNSSSTGSTPVEFRWKPSQQGPYFLRATLWRNGAIASQAIFLTGVRDPRMDEQLEVEPYQPHRGGHIADERELIGPGKMVFSSDLYHHSAPMHYLPAEKWFSEFEHAKVDLVGTLPNFEAVMPLPGVYNFAYFDHVVDLAERHGMKLEMGFWRYWFFGPDRPHWWLEDELIVDQDGKPGSGFNHALSYWGPRYRQSVQRATALIVKRYREHPSVGVWNFQPFGHVDWGWMGNLEVAFDYSQPTQAAFRRWLQTQRGFTLHSLSERYGVPLQSWEDVKLPTPQWTAQWKVARTDNQLDTRPLWLDFVEFRHWSCAESARMIYDTIRRSDPVRPLGAWMGIMAGHGEQWSHVTAEYGVAGGSNGGNIEEYTRTSLAQRRMGRPLRQEHIGQVDARLPDPVGAMHQMIFNNNLFQTKYFNYVFPVFENNPAWHEVFANPRCRQILTDMSDSQIPRSPLGVLHSYDTDWFEGRNSYAFIEIDRWWRMLAWGRYMTTQHWIEWYSNGGDLSGIGDLKIIVDNHSRLMRTNAIDALYQYVLHGGKLVLWSNSGELTYGQTDARWELLKLLGYENVEALKMTQPHGFLKPTTDQSIFKSFTQLPVNDWTPLNKKGATILATVESQPAAITWHVGKGEVLLISGEEGDPDLFGLSQIEVQETKNYWPKRSAMENQFIDTVGPLYRDLMAWAGELPPAVAVVSGPVRSCHKQKGLDTHFLSLFNDTQKPVENVTARWHLPPGTYRVQFWSLDDFQTLGDFTAAQLAEPMSLPALPAMRMRVLRVERVN